MNRDELLTALNAERYGTHAWFATPERTTPAAAPERDDDITTARRRRLLVAEYAASTLGQHDTNTNQHTA